MSFFSSIFGKCVEAVQTADYGGLRETIGGSLVTSLKALQTVLQDSKDPPTRNAILSSRQPPKRRSTDSVDSSSSASLKKTRSSDYIGESRIQFNPLLASTPLKTKGPAPTRKEYIPHPRFRKSTESSRLSKVQSDPSPTRPSEPLRNPAKTQEKQIQLHEDHLIVIPSDKDDSFQKTINASKDMERKRSESPKTLANPIRTDQSSHHRKLNGVVRTRDDLSFDDVDSELKLDHSVEEVDTDSLWKDSPCELNAPIRRKHVNSAIEAKENDGISYNKSQCSPKNRTSASLTISNKSNFLVKVMQEEPNISSEVHLRKNEESAEDKVESTFSTKSSIKLDETLPPVEKVHGDKKKNTNKLREENLDAKVYAFTPEDDDEWMLPGTCRQDRQNGEEACERRARYSLDSGVGDLNNAPKTVQTVRHLRCHFEKCNADITVYQPVNAIHHVMEHVPTDLHIYGCTLCDFTAAKAFPLKKHMMREHKFYMTRVRKDIAGILMKTVEFGVEHCFPGEMMLLEEARATTLEKLSKYKANTSI